MSLVMTLLVRDEADIVRENIEFHLARGVDHIVATDNDSRDGTTDILQEYAEAGVLTLLQEPSHDYRQSDWVNRMVAIARDEIGAQWVINNDADEFWRPPDRGGRPGDLRAVLAGCTASALRCRRHNMIASAAAIQQRGAVHWAETLVWRSNLGASLPVPADPLRDRIGLPYFYYDLPAKLLVRTEGLVAVGNGAHTAKFLHDARTEDCDITIYHFPLRRVEAFEARIRQIGDALARRPKPWGNDSWKYRRWRRMLEFDGIVRPLQEALPSRIQALFHRARGALVCDTTLRDDLAGLNVAWNAARPAGVPARAVRTEALQPIA